MNATTTAKSDVQWGDQARAILKDEIKNGGELSACPFCKVPRSQRSGYVRCCGCGINWLPGEDLDKNPTVQRFKDMVASAPKKEKPTP